MTLQALSAPRRWSLAGSLLVCGFAFAVPRVQAACTESIDGAGHPQLICSEPGTAPVTDSRNNLGITVEVGASILSTNRDNPPLRLDGDANTVMNAGLIQNSDPRNNTNAIEAWGADFTLDNHGHIDSGDRAVHLLGGAGGFTLYNRADGVITSRRQTIRSEDETASPNARVENWGLIESSNGRAIQLRGQGATVINHGTLLGGEEVVEGRLDFTLENYALIRVRAGVVDEDGVQFASGAAHNWGLIEGSDDGIDIDEGLIYNHVGGQIISTNPADTRDSAGIDADPVLQIPSLAPALHPQAGVLTIINEGLIAGPRAIAADLERTGAIDVINSGTLRGNHGIALDYAPGMGDSQLTLFGESRIFGDVRFGSGDDTVTLGMLASGLIIEGVFDGGAGANRVVFDGYELIDLLLFEVKDGLVYLVLSTVSGDLDARFRHFDQWDIGGQTFSTAALAALLPVPVPAALPLLLGGAGVLFGFCRRHAT